MSLYSFLRRMFGADPDAAEDEFDELEAPTASERHVLPAAVRPDGDPTPEGAEECVLPEPLLDAILAIVNDSLPDVVGKCLDRDAQRAYLTRALGPAAAEAARVMKSGAIRELTGDRAKMQTELEELRAERKEVNSKREEQKATLLSEQRQRRALTDRNRDLESKIAEMDAEIEQNRLTIASLMNKMRVAEVADDDMRTLRDDLKAKDGEIKELKEALAAKIAELEAPRALEAALEQRREIAGEPLRTADEETAETAKEEKPRRRRRGRPRKPAYEPDATDSTADIDSVDWLLPGGAPAGHVAPHVSDADFGYQPPRQAPAPDSDAQLTLF